MRSVQALLVSLAAVALVLTLAQPEPEPRPSAIPPLSMLVLLSGSTCRCAGDGRGNVSAGTLPEMNLTTEWSKPRSTPPALICGRDSASHFCRGADPEATGLRIVRCRCRFPGPTDFPGFDPRMAGLVDIRELSGKRYSLRWDPDTADMLVEAWAGDGDGAGIQSKNFRVRFGGGRNPGSRPRVFLVGGSPGRFLGEL